MALSVRGDLTPGVRNASGNQLVMTVVAGKEPQAGDWICFEVASGNTTGWTISSATDSGGHTGSLVTTDVAVHTFGSTRARALGRVLVNTNMTAGDTVTVTLSASTTRGSCSGVALAGYTTLAVDVVSTPVDGSASPMDSGAISNTHAVAIALAYFAVGTGSATGIGETASGSWVKQAAAANSGAGTVNIETAIDHLVLAATGSQRAQPTVTAFNATTGILVIYYDSAGGGTAYNQSLSSSTTPAGSLNRQGVRALASSTTPGGSIARQALRVLASSTTPAGSIAKQALRVLGSTMTPSGVIARAATRTLASSTTVAGSLSRLAARVLAASLTAAGSVSKQSIRGIVLTSSTTPHGALSRVGGKAVGSSTTPSGRLARSGTRTLAGSVAPIGALARQAQRALASSLSIVGLVAGVLSHAGQPFKRAFDARRRADQRTTKTTTRNYDERGPE